MGGEGRENFGTGMQKEEEDDAVGRLNTGKSSGALMQRNGNLFPVQIQ